VKCKQRGAQTTIVVVVVADVVAVVVDGKVLHKINCSKFN